MQQCKAIHTSSHFKCLPSKKKKKQTQQNKIKTKQKIKTQANKKVKKSKLNPKQIDLYSVVISYGNKIS